MKLSAGFIHDLCENNSWSYCGQYGEPGHGDADTTWVVMGDYWIRTEDGSLSSQEDKHPRIWSQLEAQGVNFEWEDEWTIDYENDKAYRTQSDSYGWSRAFGYTEDGEMITADDGLEAFVYAFKNDPTSCITKNMLPEVELLLVADGWTRQPDNDRYESGFHPGQNDDPTAIMASIQTDNPGCDVVFVLTDVGQFDVSFVAYWKSVDNDNDEV